MDMRSLRQATQTIPQIIGPFIPIEPAFIQGLEVDFILESSPDLPAWYVSQFSSHVSTIFMHILHRLSEEEQAQHEIYHKIVMAIPGLNEQVRFTIKYDPLGLGELASFIRA